MVKGSRIGYSVSERKGILYHSFNPILNRNNDFSFFEAVDADIEEAVDLAEKAFHSYKEIQGKERGAFLLEIANGIDANQKELIEVYCLESGLAESRAMIELNRTRQQLVYFSQFISNDNWRNLSFELAEGEKSKAKARLKKAFFAIGPVVVFGASNFPFAYSTIGGDTVAALAAGCPVIVKSHPFHPETSDRMATIVIEAARKCGLPNGVFSHLNTAGIEVGEKLVKHSKVKAIGFTGSIRGGKAIMKLANERENPIPVFAEMGSSNPVLIFPSALEMGIEKWATLLSESVTNGAGQFCTKPGLIFVVKESKSEVFFQKLKDRIFQKDFHCMLHPTMHQSFEMLVEQRAGLVDVYRKEGAKGENFGRQTIGIVDGKSFRENKILQEEVFGPFTLYVECQSLTEIMACLRDLQGQLTTTILTESKDDVTDELMWLMQEKAGRLILNGVPTGVEPVKAMQHGGPYPSSSDAHFTAVGVESIYRFVRPICFQNYTDDYLSDFMKVVD